MRFQTFIFLNAIIYFTGSIDCNLEHTFPLAWVSTKPSRWYSSAEVCVIKNWGIDAIDGKFYELADFYFDECHGNKAEDEWKGLICVGYGTTYRSSCTPPLVHKHKLYKALRGFNESNSPHLLKALREMRDTNRPLIFLGDSVTKQTYIAFLAEVKRLDPRVGEFYHTCLAKSETLNLCIFCIRCDVSNPKIRQQFANSGTANC